LFLAAPQIFNDLHLEEVLAVLKEALPRHIRFQPNGQPQVISDLKPDNPAKYTKPHLQFYYYFYESLNTFNVVLPTPEGEARFQAATQTNPNASTIAIPGDLQSFQVCEQSLCVIVIPHNNKDKVSEAFDFNFWDDAGVELHQISKYFSAAK